MVQLSYLYMTNRKVIALTRWTFVGKVMVFYHVDYRVGVWQDRGQDTGPFDSEDCPQPQLDERGCQAYLMQLGGKGNVSR